MFLLVFCYRARALCNCLTDVSVYIYIYIYICILYRNHNRVCRAYKQMAPFLLLYYILVGPNKN